MLSTQFEKKYTGMNSLVNYSSSEESETESQMKNTVSVKERPAQEKKRLPLPDDIKQLFSEGKHVTDDPTQHEGRIRSFPHMEGNWATQIHVPYEPEDEFHHLQEQLLLCLRPLEFKPLDSYHLSLSRTVAIRHHWIPDLKLQLTSEFARLNKSGCEINAVKVYTNDEKTRSFLALQVTTGDNTLEQYVQVVDRCFEEYKLEKYYQPPSFHVSIAWCLGDVTEKITQKISCKLKEILYAALEENPELKYFEVNEIRMKTGNKEFILPLG